MVQPEQQARTTIEQLLVAAGWHVCDASAANIHASRGVAPSSVESQSDNYHAIKRDDLQSVTPDTKAKDHFVIVDASGRFDSKGKGLNYRA